MKQWGETENPELKANNTESLRDRRKMWQFFSHYRDVTIINL